MSYRLKMLIQLLGSAAILAFAPNNVVRLIAFPVWWLLTFRRLEGRVAAAAAVLRHPLARVPQNVLKTVVGVLIVSFGTLWLGEGLGVRWPFGDAALLALVACYASVVALLLAFRGSP